MRIILAFFLLVGFAGAAVADEYYVVRDAKTKHCTIVTEKPEATMVVTQIGPLVFKTREEAQGRIKQTKVCSED